MSLEFLQIIWFLLIAILFSVYMILDGYDLGIGILHLFAKEEKQRVINLKSIGPVWDGNEVWLLVAGAGFFAAFRQVYATVFSGFYLALILLLAVLIFRATSVEYREMEEGTKWRKNWDIAFALSSIVITLLLGVALGNILGGIPLHDEAAKTATMSLHHYYSGTFFQLLDPYSLLIGLTGLALMANHGAVFLMTKSDGENAKWAEGLAAKTSIILATMFVLSSIVTMATQGHLLKNFYSHKLLFIAPLLVLLFIFLTRKYASPETAGKAFAFSSLIIVSIALLVSFSIFPNWVINSANNGAGNITIWNSSSTAYTLKVMLYLVLIGLPFVLGYTVWVQKLFWGKVKPEDDDGY